MTVDEFIKSKVPHEHRGIVRKLRAVMRVAAPDTKLVFTYGLPMWKAKRILAWMSPNQRGITLGFTRGRAVRGQVRLAARRRKRVPAPDPQDCAGCGCQGAGLLRPAGPAIRST